MRQLPVSAAYFLLSMYMAQARLIATWLGSLFVRAWVIGLDNALFC